MALTPASFWCRSSLVETYSPAEKAAQAWLRRAKKRGEVTVLGGGWWQIAGIGRLQGLHALARRLHAKGLIGEGQ
jgi:hypothetical protein